MIKRILIVDDSGISRKITRKCLEFVGLAQAEFIEAENGEKALEALERAQVDLLVTDLNMPVMDGFELLRAIDAVEAYKDLIRIVASSAASAAIEGEMTKHHVTAVLPKPLTPTTVAKLLAGKLPRGGAQP
jgi:two-component system chemotaxis response regulator CheY